jgi:hypothetical protein
MDAMHAPRLLVEAVQARRPAHGHGHARGLEALAKPMHPRVRMVAAAMVDQQDPHPLAASHR